MGNVDQKVEKFISRHHVMTLATVDSDDKPYCSNIFYSFDKERVALIFASSEDTLHAEHMAASESVAASIVLETKVVGKLQGLQITGRVVPSNDAEDRSCYLSSFPYAAVMPLTLWRLDIEFAKLTDNRLGFGKKIVWRRE